MNTALAFPLMHAPLLSVKGLSKAFAAPALKDIHFHVQAGELVTVTDENGAGKSTLSKIIAGLVAPDAGVMELQGPGYAPTSRTNAEHLGVRIVLQELSLVGTLSIAENLQLGSIPSSMGFIRHAEMNRVARAQLQRLELSELDPALPVGELGIGQQQLVEVARGLMGEVKLLILDEPTAMLTGPETARLFEQVEQLKAQGVGIVYISHPLDELSRIADRIVVLRDGSLVADRPSLEMSHETIVQAMIGHAPAREGDRAPRRAGNELLRIEGMSSGQQVRDLSARLHAGEIVGLAGLVGSGRTELLRLIFGADRKDAGDIYLNGDSSPTEIDSPSQTVARGRGLLTEDRKAQGLLLTQPLSTNLTLADLLLVSHGGWISSSAEKAATEHWFQLLRVRARGAEQVVNELSGGNQQQILLARWLHRQCQVLLLDEPTRGIDVGAREDIYAELDRIAAAGKGLLVVSSDLRELTMICDRIAVMSAGRLARVFERGEWDEEALLAAALSAHSDGLARAGGGVRV